MQLAMYYVIWKSSVWTQRETVSIMTIAKDFKAQTDIFDISDDASGM